MAGKSAESDLHYKGGLQQADHLKMLNACRLQSWHQQLIMQELEEDMGILWISISEILMKDLGIKCGHEIVLWLLSRE